MEDLGLMSFWRDKKVFVTGHTGFKGGWLCIWLNMLGAKVHGYALNPPTEPSLFKVANIEQILASHTIADIRDYETLFKTISSIQPDIVLHLAAQPLVRKSYLDPVETYSTNVMGSVNLFEAIRKTASVKAVVNVTTDKCYENQEWPWPYREYEPIGGHDPYSSSKGCSELVTSAFKRSFFSESGVALASARAGNVIGGGDWAEDRLIPDFLRAIQTNQTLSIRSPNAIRPWQHVLEPLSGYITLAEKLFTVGDKFASAWNFGPNEDDAKPVSWIVDKLVSANQGVTWNVDQNPQPHEANYLKLDSSKAKSLLQWQPKWRLTQALDKIIEWHNAWQQKADMQIVCEQQIQEYTQQKQIV